MAKAPAFKTMKITLDPGQQAVLVGFANLHSDSPTLQDLKQDIMQNAKTPQPAFGPDADISGIKALADPPEAVLPASAKGGALYWNYDFGTGPSTVVSVPAVPQHAHSITPPEMQDGPVQLTAHQKQVLWCLSRTSPQAYAGFDSQNLLGVGSYKISDADMETLGYIADDCEAEAAIKPPLPSALQHDLPPTEPLPQVNALHVAAELIDDKIDQYENRENDLTADDSYMLILCKRSRHAINAMIDVLQQGCPCDPPNLSEVDAMQVVLNMAGAHYETGNAGSTADALRALSKVGALIGHIRHMEEDPDLKRAMAQKIVDAG